MDGFNGLIKPRPRGASARCILANLLDLLVSDFGRMSDLVGSRQVGWSVSGHDQFYVLGSITI